MIHDRQLDQVDDEIDLLSMFAIFWKKKLFIFIFSLIIVSLAFFYALNQPNVYSSKTVLMPSNTDDSLTSKIGAYSSLASFAGVSVPAENITKSKEAIERIKSFDFFSNYILPNIKLENILAVKKWDQVNNSLIYDDDLFDEASKNWVRDVSFPKTTIPSDQEAFIAYIEKLTIFEKDDTFITISIDHKSPEISYNWLKLINYNINESMRSEDIKKAQSSIDFLQSSQSSTQIQSIKEAISNLLENQMQILMLASSNDSYIFKIIEPPVIPEIPSGPNRMLIVMISSFIGVMLSMLCALFLNFRELYKI